jgi:hypothetical protein
MSTQIAITAQIRPGKREQLARKLAEGPPFDLASHGFTRHQAFLGDQTVVFVFEGIGALERVNDLSRALPMTELARMGLLVQTPQVLTDSFEWQAAGGSTAPSPVTSGSR